MKDIFFIAVQKDVRTPFNFFPVLKNIVLPDNTLPIVQDMLQSFSSQADFKEQMKLAFGDGYDVSKADVLVDAWEDENLGFLPEIKIVSENQINGANGAFAGETETIYLAQEFVLENLGNVEAIASVIVEEYGHYFDGEVNSFDTPGDEGEIFASFVFGKELSADELLRMKVEDDWAIGFLDGEMVSIEQQASFPMETNTLDFFAENVSVWENLDFGIGGEIDGLVTPPIDVPLNISLPPASPINAAAIEGNLTASVGIIPFVNAVNLGRATFNYPINIDVERSKETLGLGENFSLETTPSVGEASFSGSGFNLGSTGIDLTYEIGPISFDRISIGNVAGFSLFETNIDPITFEGFKARTNLISLASPEPRAELDFFDGLFKATLELPQIKNFESNKLESPEALLPGFEGKQTGNLLTLAGDVDLAVANLIPAYGGLAQRIEEALGKTPFADAELKGLGFSLTVPNQPGSR